MASGIRESPSGDSVNRKRELRAEVRRRLASLDSAQIQTASAQAVRQLLSDPRWHDAQAILAYSPIGHELNLWPAFDTARALGKKIALPRFDAHSGTYCAAVIPDDKGALAQAAFGILEPPPSAPCIPLNRLDFAVVPGLAFDPWGRRLGRGKGFYDRLLVQVNGIKCGVALDQQIVEELPAEPHDIVMNLILTPTRWLFMPPGAS